LGSDPEGIDDQGFRTHGEFSPPSPPLPLKAHIPVSRLDFEGEGRRRRRRMRKRKFPTCGKV